MLNTEYRVPSAEPAGTLPLRLGGKDVGTGDSELATVT